jgi:hypothetical protein
VCRQVPICVPVCEPCCPPCMPDSCSFKPRMHEWLSRFACRGAECAAPVCIDGCPAR